MADEPQQPTETDKEYKVEEVRKALFQQGNNEDYTSEASEALLSRLQIEHDVETSMRALQKDLHEQRLKQLRQLQNVITEDNWRYPSIEKLLGFQ